MAVDDVKILVQNGMERVARGRNNGSGGQWNLANNLWAPIDLTVAPHAQDLGLFYECDTRLKDGTAVAECTLFYLLSN